MQILLIVPLSLVLLIIAYLLVLRFRLLGKGIAFICQVLGRTFIHLHQHLTDAASYCNKACRATLVFPSAAADTESSAVAKVLARLVFLVLALLLLLGDVFGTLSAMPTLLHTTSHIQLPDVLELASAALFIGSVGLFGAIVLEVGSLIPPGCGLFPPMSKNTGCALGLLSGLFLLLAFATTCCFYIYRGVYLLDPDSGQGLSVLILAGIGLSTAAASVVALWALVIGLMGVISVILWTLEQGCRCGAALSQVLTSLLEIVSVHLSQGTMSVRAEYLGPHAYQVPAPRFLSPVTQLSLSANGGQIVDAATTQTLPTETLEDSVKNLDKTVSFVSVGNCGSRLYTPIMRKIESLGAAGMVLSSCCIDIRSAPPQKYTMGVDLSPRVRLICEAVQPGKTEADTYVALLKEVSAQLVETYVKAKIFGSSPLLYIVDAKELPCITDMLIDNKSRLPMSSQFVIIFFTSAEKYSEQVQQGLVTLRRLHEQEYVDGVLLLDPRSPFASPFGEETQLQFVSQMIASLLVAHKQSEQNESFPHLLQEMRKASLFMAASFASQVIAVGKMPTRWAWVPGLAGKAGSGSYSDILTQTCRAIDQVLTQHDTCAFPEVVETNLPCRVVVNVPLELRDPRFQNCLRDVSQYMRTHYPYAASLTVRGNGCSYPTATSSPFFVQASCIYAIPEGKLLTHSQDTHSHISALLPLTAVSEPESIDGLMNAGSNDGDAPAAGTKTKQNGTSPRGRRRAQA